MDELLGYRLFTQEEFFQLENKGKSRVPVYIIPYLGNEIDQRPAKILIAKKNSYGCWMKNGFIIYPYSKYHVSNDKNKDYYCVKRRGPFYPAFTLNDPGNNVLIGGKDKSTKYVSQQIFNEFHEETGEFLSSESVVNFKAGYVYKMSDTQQTALCYFYGYQLISLDELTTLCSSINDNIFQDYMNYSTGKLIYNLTIGIEPKVFDNELDSVRIEDIDNIMLFKDHQDWYKAIIQALQS